MIIGVVKEIKNNENRVGLTPENASEYVRAGHTVYIESNAGFGVNFKDFDYETMGCHILKTAKEVYNVAEMIIKVKEPIESEYELLKPNTILFTYLHLAANKPLLDVLLKKNIIGIAYETIEDNRGNLPCLRPMSEIAGQLSIQEGAKYIESTYGGKGILLGGVPGVERGKVTIIGGGVSGTYAAKVALGLGANVTILDKNMSRLEYLNDIFGNAITTLYSNNTNIEKCLRNADLVVGSVLLPGSKAPKLITEELVKKMKKGSVFVDIAIDQGGCSETSVATTHDNPIYIKHGVVHYCVANMPGSVPYTSTIALTNVTLPYGLMIANNGVKKALELTKGLVPGVNTYLGYCTNKNLAGSLGIEYTDLNELL